MPGRGIREYAEYAYVCTALVSPGQEEGNSARIDKSICMDYKRSEHCGGLSPSYLHRTVCTPYVRSTYLMYSHILVRSRQYVRSRSIPLI